MQLPSAGANIALEARIYVQDKYARVCMHASVCMRVYEGEREREGEGQGDRDTVWLKVIRKAGNMWKLS